MKKVRENPVPTGTEYRISRPDTIFTGKTGNRKKLGKPGETGVEIG
jgi:hypothetical protein